MVEYGSSASLDTDFDLVVTQDGDIKTTLEEPSPSAELQKDLSYFTAHALEKQLGKPVNPVTRASFEQVVRDVVTNDPRVRRIVSFNIQTLEEEDGYKIDMTIQDSSQSRQNIIFTV